jgi:hypothetical protein
MSNNNKTRKNKGVKKFTEKMQEAFTLRITGLNNKQIKEETGAISEDAVEQLLTRVIHFYELDGGIRCIEAAIGKATADGLTEKLFIKYRNKHRVHIERFERKKLTAPVENLPGWEEPK